jgi:hypothetical protein
MEVGYKLFSWLKNSNIITSSYSFPSEKVKLTAEDSEKLELGLIIPLLKPFYSGTLPSLSDLKQTNSSVSRLYN